MRAAQVPTRSKDKAPQKKFSSMIKSLVVDLERDPNLYTDGNIVEVSLDYIVTYI